MRVNVEFGRRLFSTTVIYNYREHGNYTLSVLINTNKNTKHRNT